MELTFQDTEMSDQEKQKTQKELSREEIMEAYSELLLTTGERPKTVYLFTQKLGIEEAAFYHYFSSLERLEQEFLVHFFQESLKLTQQIEGYEQMNAKEKLLNLYYIFFENLAMNRSLVRLILSSNLKSKYKKLKSLRKEHRNYTGTLDIKDWAILENLPEKLKTSRHYSKQEVLWFHFVSVLKFWMEDASSDFEKTDAYIEKSMDLGWEMVEHPIASKFFDFGKFIWQEKFD